MNREIRDNLENLESRYAFMEDFRECCDDIERSFMQEIRNSNLDDTKLNKVRKDIILYKILWELKGKNEIPPISELKNIIRKNSFELYSEYIEKVKTL